MRSGTGRWAVLLGMAALTAGALRADDLSGLKREMEEVRTRTAAMESCRATQGEAGDATALTTIKRKGTVQIGGDVNMDIIFKERDDVTDDQDEITSTEFHTNSANLRFKVNASRDLYLYLKLDLDDDWETSQGGQDDLLEECKFVWNHVRGSCWGLIFGKGEVPYGQDRTLGIIQSYHHNDTANGYSGEGPVFLLSATEEADPTDVLNPHALVGNISKPGEVDNVFQIGVNYVWQDILKFEAALYQNNDSTGGGRLTRGMHEDRSDDHLGFQSFALRLWAMPMEGMTVELSFLNEHCDSMGDASRGPRGESDQRAVSLGFAYQAKTVPFEFFGEYARGWDWNYLDDYDTDTFQLGVIWGLTEAFDLGLMGEFLHIDDNGVEDDYYKMVLSGKYYYDNGMYMILEYGHEWYNGDIPRSVSSSDDRDADVFAFRTGWAF